MNAPARRTTAAAEILFAANDLASAGAAEFSEWDLTVAAWRRDPNRFGCRGYESQYPDHKRVMMEIMGQTKKDNPLRRGWITRTRANHYGITPLGRNEANRGQSTSGEHSVTERSPQDIYDAISPYFGSLTFKKFLRDSSEPKMWLGAASFLGISRNEALHLNDRLEAARAAIFQSLAWFDETGQVSLRRGATGSGISITRTDVEKLQSLLAMIKERFAIQLEAIQKTKTKK
jgi:hypothetical protein